MIGGELRVLRVSHSAAVDEWRGRERAIGRLGVDVRLLSAKRSSEGAGSVQFRARPGETASGIVTWGTHPALFVYDPRPIWAALGGSWDLIDIHEEPFALATAEILLLRALRRNRAPVVLYTAQNLWKRYPIPFRWFERQALRHAAGISACNAQAADIVVAKGFAGRPRVIPLGFDPEKFGPLEADSPEAGPTRDRESRDSDAASESAAIIVGYLGRMLPEKGLDVLVDALSVEPRLHLRVGGVGPYSAQILASVTERGLTDRFEYVGAVPPRDVASFFSSVDVVAVPSLTTPSWTEQFGRVAIEAMACGVPVVTSDAGALPDVVAGAGIVVPEGDPRALANALAYAAGPRRSELRAAGFARAATCTWDAVAADYMDLYRSVTRGSQPETEHPIEVVVVAYGSPGLLRQALEPVASLPVTVVDNSSLPEIAEICAQLGVRYLDSGANRGFGAAVNVALANRLVPGADVLLLNPDARIEPDQIDILRQTLRADGSLASVAPQQRSDDGRRARVEWTFPSPGNALAEAVGAARWQHGARFVIGSVLLLRAEALDQVGGFDERFFLYAEETDWAYRAHLLGWNHAEVVEATAAHVGAGTGGDPRRREAHFHASQERFYRKHFGATGWAIARAAVWAGAMARAAVLSGEPARDARRRAALYRIGPTRVEARLGQGSPS